MTIDELVEACRKATEKRVAASREAQIAMDDANTLERQYQLRKREESDAYSKLQARVKSAAEGSTEIEVMQ